jgi:maltose O-acetyltransferase
MNRLVDRLAFVIDELLSKIKTRAMQHRLTMYPHIHSSVKIGGNSNLVGPCNNFIIGEGTYINDAMLVAGEHAKVNIGKNCAIAYRVSIKAESHDVNDPCPNENGPATILTPLQVEPGHIEFIISETKKPLN